MDIRKVSTAAEDTAFIEVHVTLNSGNPNWVRPIDKDITDVFDPANNKLFIYGEACRWLVWSSG